MKSSFSFFPEAASTFAPQVDALYMFLVLLTLFFTVAIYFAVLFFALKYRRTPENQQGVHIHGNNLLEIIWSVIPLGIVMIIFVWGAVLFLRGIHSPEGALEITGVPKQWMWKFQHPQGKREINQLHVPVGKPVKMIMTSEDVIHSFYVPAFRVKQDVLPNRYSSVSFEPTKPGTYHLFCAEYCGTSHSQMIGSVVVMEPADYQAWLAGTAGAGTPLSQAELGQKVFQQLNCQSCHSDPLRAPALEGLLGKAVELEEGRIVTADRNYIRESLMNPNAKIVRGFQPIMPTYSGQITEEEIMQLISYLSQSPNQAETPAAQSTGQAPPKGV